MYSLVRNKFHVFYDVTTFDTIAYKICFEFEKNLQQNYIWAIFLNDMKYKFFRYRFFVVSNNIL